jgi:hypothetical protein
MASHVDTATLALIALVANLLLMTMSDDLKRRLKESWDIFWPPWQDRTHTSSHRSATDRSVVPERSSSEDVQVERGPSRALDAEPVPRSSRDGTGSRVHQPTGDTAIPVDGAKERAGRESKPDTGMVKAVPRPTPEVGKGETSQVKSSHKTKEEVETPKAKSVSSRELAGPNAQGTDPSERESAKKEAYAKARREAHERAKAKDIETSTTQRSDSRSAGELQKSQAKDEDGGVALKLSEGVQTDKEKAKRESYEKAKREAYVKSRAERTAKTSTGDQVATKSISTDVVDDAEKSRAKSGSGIDVGREAKERDRSKRGEAQAKGKGRDVPPHMARSEGGDPDESAELQAKREAYEKAKKRATADSAGAATVQTKKDAPKEISVARTADKSTTIRMSESEEDRLKRKALEKARLEAYEKAKCEKGVVDGEISAIKAGPINKGGSTESEKAQKSRSSSASVDRPKAAASAASKGEELEEDKP